MLSAGGIILTLTSYVVFAARLEIVSARSDLSTIPELVQFVSDNLRYSIL